MEILNKFENILNYLFKLDHYFINCKSYYEKYYNKKNTIYIESKNNNKLPNDIIKLILYYNIEYLNNLPLHSKWLTSSKVNCNLPPYLIFLECNYYDIHNLPKSLQFLWSFSIINIHNKIILNNINIKKYVLKLLYHYLNSILNNNIIINNWNKQYCNSFYILK